MKKYLVLSALCVGLMATVVSCDDPMEDITPIKEQPQITTDGTGDGSGPEKDKPGSGQ